jgi:hypothetical protein
MICLEGRELFHENGVKLGKVLPDVDGYYKFWPELRGGYWDESILGQIANLLTKMNGPWDKTVKDYFEKSPD